MRRPRRPLEVPDGRFNPFGALEGSGLASPVLLQVAAFVVVYGAEPARARIPDRGGVASFLAPSRREEEAYSGYVDDEQRRTREKDAAPTMRS
jgi:hypothetical protein